MVRTWVRVAASVSHLSFGLFRRVGLLTFTLRDLLTPALLAHLWGGGFLHSGLLLERKCLSYTSRAPPGPSARQEVPPNTHTHHQPWCLGSLWQDMGTEYLGRLPRLLGFAIAAGRADPSRRGPAPRSQFFPGPRGLFLPSTPH